MGGSIRKDMVAKVTHLIANCCGGEKYQYATTFKVPIMSQDWVTACWNKRNDVNLCSVKDELIVSIFVLVIIYPKLRNSKRKHKHANIKYVYRVK